MTWHQAAMRPIQQALRLSDAGPCAPPHRRADIRNPSQKQSFELRASRSPVVRRQGNNELRKDAGLGVDIDPAAMLLDYDVMSHREPKACSFSRRFRREKGIEHFFLYVGRDTRSVVAN